MSTPPTSRSAAAATWPPAPAASVVSRRSAEAILRDPRFGVQLDTADTPPSRIDLAQGPLSGSFLELDPPRHTRLRRLTAPAFRPKLIRDFTRVVDQVLGDPRPAGGTRTVRLMADLADGFLITVISRLLGIPAADATHFSQIGELVGQSLDGVRTVRQAQELRRAGRELAVLFRRLAAERRRDPQDDVISLLATAEAGGELTEDDLVATCGLLLVAGFETTVNLIGNAVAALRRDSEAWSQLVADPGPGRGGRGGDPALRPTGPDDRPVRPRGRGAGRTPTAEGDGVAVLLAAANRDPAAYADPDRFRLDRQDELEHLAFSSGIHYRLEGAAGPARGRARAGAGRTWPDLILLPGARRRTGTTIRGFASLPVSARRLPVRTR